MPATNDYNLISADSHGGATDHLESGVLRSLRDGAQAPSPRWWQRGSSTEPIRCRCRQPQRRAAGTVPTAPWRRTASWDAVLPSLYDPAERINTVGRQRRRRDPLPVDGPLGRDHQLEDVAEAR
jgi:hypothetical protein